MTELNNLWYAGVGVASTSFLLMTVGHAIESTALLGGAALASTITLSLALYVATDGNLTIEAVRAGGRDD